MPTAHLFSKTTKLLLPSICQRVLCGIYVNLIYVHDLSPYSLLFSFGRVLGDRFTARVNRTQLVESSTSREGSFSTEHYPQALGHRLAALALALALPDSIQVVPSSRWSLHRRHRCPPPPPPPSLVCPSPSWMSNRCRHCVCQHHRQVPRLHVVRPHSAWTHPVARAPCTPACWSIRSPSWRRMTMITC